MPNFMQQIRDADAGCRAGQPTRSAHPDRPDSAWLVGRRTRWQGRHQPQHTHCAGTRQARARRWACASPSCGRSVSTRPWMLSPIRTLTCTARRSRRLAAPRVQASPGRRATTMTSEREAVRLHPAARHSGDGARGAAQGADAARRHADWASFAMAIVTCKDQRRWHSIHSTCRSLDRSSSSPSSEASPARCGMPALMPGGGA